MKVRDNLTRISGTLMPCFKKWPDKKKATYKVQSDSGVFYLVLNQDQELCADSMVWGRIDVMGRVDRENNRLIVTELNGNEIFEEYFGMLDDFPLGRQELEKRIQQLGKIEPEDDLIAS